MVLMDTLKPAGSCMVLMDTLKPAGSCMVLMDTLKYIEQGRQFREDQTTSKKLGRHDPSERNHRNSQQLLNKYKDQRKWTKKHHTTNPEDVRTQKLYFLHKVQRTTYKLHPIISCCSGPTSCYGHQHGVLASTPDPMTTSNCNPLNNVLQELLEQILQQNMFELQQTSRVPVSPQH